MRHYRVYLLGHDGRFIAAKNIECVGDQEAMEKTQRAVNGQDIELWESGRFVARFKGADLQTNG